MSASVESNPSLSAVLSAPRSDTRTGVLLGLRDAVAGF